MPRKRPPKNSAQAEDRFPWPRTGRGGKAPVWDGRMFRIGSEKRRVLSYGGDKASWDQELTAFHEEQAGTGHPIDRASRKLAISSLSRFLKVKDPVILEVGSSSGFLLPQLQAAFPSAYVIGSDNFSDSLRRMAPALKGIPLAQFDLTRCPLATASVDAVVLLNVLEHIRDDAKALAECYRILRPGGLAVVEVPAGPGLYDIYDEMLGHERRYSMAALLGRSRAQGFRILRGSHLGFFIFPAFAAVKLLNRRFKGREAGGKREQVAQNISATRDNGLMDRILQWELALGKILTFPLGIRCSLVLQKP